MLAAMSMHDNCHGGRLVRLRLRGSDDAHGRGDAYGTVPYGSGDARGRRAALGGGESARTVDLTLVAVTCCCCAGLAGVNSY